MIKFGSFMLLLPLHHLQNALNISIVNTPAQKLIRAITVSLSTFYLFLIIAKSCAMPIIRIAKEKLPFAISVISVLINVIYPP